VSSNRSLGGFIGVDDCEYQRCGLDVAEQTFVLLKTAFSPRAWPSPPRPERRKTPKKAASTAFFSHSSQGDAPWSLSLRFRVSRKVTVNDQPSTDFGHFGLRDGWQCSGVGGG
jgi:hypothetical protein